jgi:putative tryptophan/tyrosine transport system substrate-binding protein
VAGDPVTFFRRTRLIEFARVQRIPTMYPTRTFADDGGLMAYGPNLPGMVRDASRYVDKLLRGANPAELPVERPTKFELVINLKTAKALDLTIPPSVLARADEVIQ